MNAVQKINNHTGYNTQENYDIQVLSGVITKNINEWLNRKSANSKRNLTVMTGLARNSIHQLAKGEASILNLHPSKIILVLAKTERLTNQEAFKKYEKELKTLLKLSRYKHITSDIENFHETNNDRFEYAINTVLCDYESTIIYVLSTMEGGIRKDEIRTILGRRAFSKIPRLADLNLVHILGDVIRAKTQSNQSFTDEQINRIIPMLANFYNRENSDEKGTGSNFLKLINQKLNKRALDDVKAIMTEATERINKIVSNPSNQGPNLCYSFMQMDTFNEETIS